MKGISINAQNFTHRNKNTFMLMTFLESLFTTDFLKIN
jgi:hypothetical protein